MFSSPTWNNDKELIKYSWLIFGISIAYWGSLVICNAVWSLEIFFMYTNCLEIVKNSVVKIMIGEIMRYILVFLPMTCCILATVFMDFHCLIKIKSRGIATAEEMSLRATITSSIMTIPYVVLCCISINFFGLNEKLKWFLLTSLYFIFITFRNPVIATCAFRVNEVNQQIDLEAQRERKRQIEINDAIKARKDRIAGINR